MNDRKRKWVYWSTVVGSFALLTGLGWLALGLLAPLIGVDPGRLRGGLHGPFLYGAGAGLSWVIAARVLRRFGLSLEGNKTETLVRREGGQPRMPQGRVIVTAVHPWALGLAGVLTGAAALGSAVLAAQGTGPGWIIAGLTGITSAVCWRGCFTDSRFTCTADQEGVTSHSLLAATPRRIPWAQIGGCTVHASQDALGRQTGTLCTLFDHTGRELLQLNLGAVEAYEREAFLAAVRARLGSSARSELIAAEAPAGLGTELEATQAPAGRGTEPEAAMGPVPDAEPAQGVSTQVSGRASSTVPQRQDGSPPGRRS